MEGHTNASDRLRPRPDQTHPSRQRRHAGSLVRARPALLPGPLVVPSTPHRRSTRRSPRQRPRPTRAATPRAHTSTRAPTHDTSTHCTSAYGTPTHAKPTRRKPAQRPSVPPKRANQFEPTHEINGPQPGATAGGFCARPRGVRQRSSTQRSRQPDGRAGAGSCCPLPRSPPTLPAHAHHHHQRQEV